MKKTASKKSGIGLTDVAQVVAHLESDMPYILKRGNAYWFNRRAPSPLKRGFEFILVDREVKVGKNGYVRFSLGSIDRKVAKSMALSYAHALDKVVSRLLAAIPDTRPIASPSPPVIEPDRPTPQEIERAAIAMRAVLLSADDQATREAVTQLLANETDIRIPDREVVTSDLLPPTGVAGETRLLKMLGQMACFYVYQTSEKVVTEIGPELLPFVTEFRQLVRDLEARKRNEIVLVPEIPSPPPPAWSWADALDYYFSQNELVDKTKKLYRQAWLSLGSSSKVQPKDLEHHHVIHWRDEVLKKTVADTTAKNRLGHVSAIWHAARKARYIPRETPDPFEDIEVKVKKNRRTSRTQFTYGELQKIFDAEPPQTASAVSVQAGYWIPMLAAYYGARLEELTGIEMTDVIETSEGITLWIRPNSTRNIKGGEAAARWLPLHPTLKELGFEDYCNTARKADVKNLFPSISRSQSFGEVFVDHCQKVLDSAPGRKVGMHCFRHSWETAKRNAEPNFDYSVGCYITGRSIDKGSAALYGSEAGTPKILAELKKITYGIKHRPAPHVTSMMLKEQEELCKRNQAIGERRRKER